MLFKKEEMVLPGSAVLNQASGICVHMKRETAAFMTKTISVREGGQYKNF
jgi:hypothetical protein